MSEAASPWDGGWLREATRLKQNKKK